MKENVSRWYFQCGSQNSPRNLVSNLYEFNICPPFRVMWLQVKDGPKGKLKIWPEWVNWPWLKIFLKTDSLHIVLGAEIPTYNLAEGHCEHEQMKTELEWKGFGHSQRANYRMSEAYWTFVVCPVLRKMIWKDGEKYGHIAITLRKLQWMRVFHLKT